MTTAAFVGIVEAHLIACGLAGGRCRWRVIAAVAGAPLREGILKPCSKALRHAHSSTVGGRRVAVVDKDRTIDEGVENRDGSAETAIHKPVLRA